MFLFKYIVHVHETRKVVRPTSGSYVHRAAFFYNVILVGHPSYLIWVNHYCLKIVMLDRSGGCVVYTRYVGTPLLAAIEHG
jgi:hypothetical protein